MGEIIMGTGGLHPTVEARAKGWRSWGEDSVSWRLGQPGGGARGGAWPGGGSGSSFHGEVQLLRQQQQLMRHKGKVAEEEDAFRGSEERESEEKDQKPGAAAQSAVGAHKTGGGCASAAANGLGSDAFESATGAAAGTPTEHASAARKRKNFAWSCGSSRSARSPSSSSSSVKTEISSGGGGITSYMHAGDYQPVKDEEEKNLEEKQQLPVNGRKDNPGNNNNISGKRRRSPAVLMEGSRCSRVNGRGWRCCQQTLVGYSLCEHHLGKGRLRSVSSVRCKKAGGADTGKQLPSQQVSAVIQQLNDKQRPRLAAEAIDDDEDEEETKPAVGARRGKRIGVVKARSISSLMGQTCSDVVDYSGAIQEAVAPEMAPSVTSAAGLPAAAVRSPIVSSTAVTAAASTSTGSLPPPTAAHQEGITAVM